MLHHCHHHLIFISQTKKVCCCKKNNSLILFFYLFKKSVFIIRLGVNKKQEFVVMIKTVGFSAVVFFTTPNCSIIYQTVKKYFEGQSNGNFFVHFFCYNNSTLSNPFALLLMMIIIIIIFFSSSH